MGITMHAAPPFVYKTTTLRVREDTLPCVLTALEELALYAYGHEPGTRLCAWFQDKDEPTNILQVMVFDDESAESVHRASAPARRLSELLESGELTRGAVTEWHVLTGV